MLMGFSRQEKVERGLLQYLNWFCFLILDNINQVSLFITKTSCNRTYPMRRMDK